MPQQNRALVGVAAAADQGEIAGERMALLSRLDVVVVWRPIGDLHCLTAVGATRADDGLQQGAMWNGGHGKKSPVERGELGRGSVEPALRAT